MVALKFVSPTSYGKFESKSEKEQVAIVIVYGIAKETKRSFGIVFGCCGNTCRRHEGANVKECVKIENSEALFLNKYEENEVVKRIVKGMIKNREYIMANRKRWIQEYEKNGSKWSEEFVEFFNKEFNSLMETNQQTTTTTTASTAPTTTTTISVPKTITRSSKTSKSETSEIEELKKKNQQLEQQMIEMMKTMQQLMTIQNNLKH